MATIIPDERLKNVLMQSLAARHFWAFCCYYDDAFFRKNRRFLKNVALLFQKVYDEYAKHGNAISVAVSMPPRAGKSYITSLFCAWWLGMEKEAAIMRNTCTAKLYDKLSLDTRNIVASERFKDVFPNVELGDKTSIAAWNTNYAKQCSYFGAGVGGTIIGFGATLAITDDLYKSFTDAISETTNDSVKTWKQSAHDSRKERGCPEIFIGTRWTINDVIGIAIREKIKPEHYICIAAIDAEGNSFCDNVKTTEEYDAIRSEIEPSIWMAEYMQEPLDVKGTLMPLDALRFADVDSISADAAIWRFAIGDPADKGGDYYAVPYVYVMPNFDCYVKDVLFNKNGIEANAQRIVEKALQLHIEQLTMEANGGWISCVPVLKNACSAIVGDAAQSIIRINGYSVQANKLVRILSSYEFVLRHFVFDKQYKQKPEYAQFIQNVTRFTKEGKNANDDGPDVICAAANMVKIKYAKILYGNYSKKK